MKRSLCLLSTFLVLLTTVAIVAAADTPTLTVDKAACTITDGTYTYLYEIIVIAVIILFQ